jgi:translation initiation factor IF-2
MAKIEKEKTKSKIKTKAQKVVSKVTKAKPAKKTLAKLEHKVAKVIPSKPKAVVRRKKVSGSILPPKPYREKVTHIQETILPVKVILPAEEKIAKEVSLPVEIKPPVKVEKPKEIPENLEKKIEKEDSGVKDSVSPELKVLELNLPITVKDLAVKLQNKPSLVIKTLMEMGLMVGINQVLDESAVAKVCEKFSFKMKKAPDQEETVLQIHNITDKSEHLIRRSPVVTFMGHVDHGKTSLLDAIRKTKVVDAEHGGITQHIGAYRVDLSNGDITFLDTPGHEAFTAMRARGASITDIVVLVVAAEDGVMPQTQEAIDHARAAGVSIIVAINKIDKPQANIERVKKQLSELNLTSEDWGGKTITVPVSAKTGKGIDELLEMILLEAQILELKANPNRLARGIVIEAKMSKGKGPVSTLLIKNGTLRLNDNIIVGNYYGKIRAMFDDHGKSVAEAPPSFPVEALGISNVPQAGEQFFVIERRPPKNWH